MVSVVNLRIRSKDKYWQKKNAAFFATTGPAVSLPKPDSGRKSRFLPRDAMHKRGLCRHVVSVCLCVCPSVTFVSSVETNERIFNSYFTSRVSVCYTHSHAGVNPERGIWGIFLPLGSQAILVFQYQTSWRYSDGNPPPLLTAASNAKGI